MVQPGPADPRHPALSAPDWTGIGRRRSSTQTGREPAAFGWFLLVSSSELRPGCRPAPIPGAEWGAMLSDSRKWMTVAPHPMVAPGIALRMRWMLNTEHTR